MPKYCCAPNCFNNNKDKKTKHFHVFPKDEIRRNEWMERLNFRRSLTKHMVVCSDHFDESDYFVTDYGRGDKELLKKTSIPKRLLQEEDDVKGMPANQLHQIYLYSENVKVEPGSDTEILGTSRDPLDDEFNDSCEGVEVSVQATSEMKPVVILAKPGVGVGRTSGIKSVCIKAKPAVKKAALPTVLLHKRTSFCSLSDDDLIYFTGIERERFPIVYNMLEKFNPIEDRLLWTKKDALVITLFKCKHNLDFKMMEFIFELDRKFISEIFKEVIEKLYVVFRRIDIWKLSFKDSNSYRCIIDLQQLTFSSNTHHHHPTFKLLVSCDEKGTVNFISKAFVGSTSDRELVEKSELLNKLEKGDTVLGNKDLCISDLLESKGVLLNIPPSLKREQQSSKYEEMKTCANVKKRILIQSAIGRAKKNAILTTPMQNCLWPYANKIIYVCFALVNFYKPLK